MRRILACWVVVVTSSVVGCGDDGGNRLPPDTTIDDKPAPLTNQTHARFTFHADGVATSFVCEIDGTPSECIPVRGRPRRRRHHLVAALQKLKADDSRRPTTGRSIRRRPIPRSPAAAGGRQCGHRNVHVHVARYRRDVQCALDGGAFAACMTPNAITPGDGDHSYQVRAVDLAGNVDPTPAVRGRSTPPRPTRQSSPAPPTPDDGPRVRSRSTRRPTATFECSTDAAAFAACTSPVSLPALANGAQYVRGAREGRTASSTRRPRTARGRSTRSRRRSRSSDAGEPDERQHAVVRVQLHRYDRDVRMSDRRRRHVHRVQRRLTARRSPTATRSASARPIRSATVDRNIHVDHRHRSRRPRRSRAARAAASRRRPRPTVHHRGRPHRDRLQPRWRHVRDLHVAEDVHRPRRRRTRSSFARPTPPATAAATRGCSPSTPCRRS